MASKSRLETLQNIIQSSKNARALYEPTWYVDYNAYENNHFVVWLPVSKQIVKVPMRGNKFFNQIPEVRKQVDTIQNMLLSNEVIPVVYPVFMDKASVYWAKKISDYLLYLYKHWMFLGRLHDAVHDALVMPVSYFQLLPPETNDGKMEILELDAFDVFVPEGIKDVQSKECNYVGKSVRRPVEAIRADQNYNSNRNKVTGSAKFSTADFKDTLMSERTGTGSAPGKAAKAVVDELWIKEYQKDGTIKVRVITVCEDQILRDELTNYDRLPFVSLKLHQGILYQPSFVDYILPMNRTIDLTQSRMEDMFLKTLKGTVLAQYGSNIHRTTDENGEILYWKLSKPEYQQPPEIPPIFLNYLNMNFQWIERQGASAASIGATPKGVKTYRTVEAMRQQDYAALKTPMDFMKIALTQLFNLVIYFASQYYLEPVGVKIYEREDYNVFNVLGSNGLPYNMDKFQEANGDMTKAPVIIHKDNVVEVEFESAMSYTMEGKRQTVFEAVKAGMLSKEDGIRMLKLGNVRDIMENLEKQAQAEQAQEQKQQAQEANGTTPNNPTPPAPAAAPQPPAPQPMPNGQTMNLPQ